MSDHSADCEPLSAGPDATIQEPEAGGDYHSRHITDSKAKKRLQNRVAQRLYRQRMKARVENLQAKVEQLEGTKQGTIAMEPTASPLSTFGMPRIDAQDKFCGATLIHAGLFSTGGESHIGPRYGSEASAANMMCNTSPTATRNLSTAMMKPSPMNSKSPPSHHMASFNLLNSSTVPASMPPDMSANMALNNHHLQSAPFGDHQQCFDYYGDLSGHQTRPPNFMHAVTFPESQATTSTTNVSSTSQPQSPPSGSSLTSDFMPPMSGLNSPNESYRSSSMASAELPPSRSAPHLENGASVEERIKYVSEQAKFVSFPDLDALITAYYTVLASDSSSALGDGEGGAARRLPRLIATLRHAVQEWRDWERKGFPLD